MPQTNIEIIEIIVVPGPHPKYQAPIQRRKGKFREEIERPKIKVSEVPNSSSKTCLGSHRNAFGSAFGGSHEPLFRS